MSDLGAVLGAVCDRKIEICNDCKQLHGQFDSLSGNHIGDLGGSVPPALSPASSIRRDPLVRYTQIKKPFFTNIASPKDHTSDARRPVTRLHGVWDKQEPSEKDGVMVAIHRPDKGNATQSTRLS